MAITPDLLRTAFAGLAPGAASGMPGITEVVDEPVPAEVRERLLSGRRPAAVLIPIFQQGPHEPLRLLLTQRTAHLRDHAGQISFPGGGLNPGEGAIAGALREAQEEIGLDPARVEIFGQMPQYQTGTGFSVSPMIGFVQTPCDLVPDAGEVADIFDVPLDFILDPRNMRQETRFYRGAWRSFLAVPWSGRYIWGATAGMLAQLSRIVRAAN
jgi:8-oxo-dGTP pyrophosphatase MutT (NUDIX family)